MTIILLKFFIYFNYFFHNLFSERGFRSPVQDPASTSCQSGPDRRAVRIHLGDGPRQLGRLAVRVPRHHPRLRRSHQHQRSYLSR